MRIFSLGGDYFHEAFQALGHTVIAAPPEDGFPADMALNSFSDRPDILIYTDNLGKKNWPSGLDKIDIPKIYYAVDTPINVWWQKDFAPLFDFVLADQKSFTKQLSNNKVSAHWLPVGVDTKKYASLDNQDVEEIYDFAFVGVSDENNRPKRKKLIDLLSSRYSVKNIGSRQQGWVTAQEASKLYRQSRMVLNENLFPGVTTRMLEAMASKAFLFTEKAGGDLGELFKAGEDFAWFEPNNILEVAEYWLKNKDLRKKAANRAFEKICNSHDIVHRAETLLGKICNLSQESYALKEGEAWDREGRALFWTALRWPEENGLQRFKRAERLLIQASESSKLSAEGMFMLGQMARMENNSFTANKWLKQSWENQYFRAALAMAMMHLSQNEVSEATFWLGEFTGQGNNFPKLKPGIIHYEAALLIANKLDEIGESISPGFNRSIHDPAIWTAFEFYLASFKHENTPLEAGQKLSQILIQQGAFEEAKQVSSKALSHYPSDSLLQSIQIQAAQGSYMELH